MLSSLFDDTGNFACYCGCAEFEEPTAIAQVASEIASDLADRGQPLDGPLRVVSVKNWQYCEGYEGTGPDEALIQTAPLTFDPAAIAIPGCSESGVAIATQSHIVEGEAAVDLRALRRTYREVLQETGSSTTAAIYMRAPDGDVYDVFIRDYIPLEDENGLVNPHSDENLEEVAPGEK